MPLLMSQGLQMDLMSDAVKIANRISDIGCYQFGQLFGDTIDGLIRQFFGVQAAMRFESPNQSGANLLISLARLLPVLMEPGKQLIETLLR